LATFPELNQEVLYTGTYYDGAMNSPERIAIELLQDAVEANPRAIPLNYVSFLSADSDVVTLRDEMTDERLMLKPSIIINASGPWIDLVNRSMGEQTNYIGGTKGSHLILDHNQLRQGIGDHEFFFENKDGRIVLIFPLLDKVLIGTSDIPIDDPDKAGITGEEVDYFFEMIGRVFPKIQVDRSHILYAFSGVRPLQSSEAGVAGQISRDHKVQVNEPDDSLAIPVFSLVGGKWTSFRAFSEHTADLILERLAISRSISTEDVPIGGGRGYPGNSQRKDAYLDQINGVSKGNREQLCQLFERHGTMIDSILAGFPAEVFQPLETVPALSVGEIKYTVMQEDVCHLDDLCLRRTMLAKLGWITPGSLDEISKICGDTLNWSDAKRNQEINRLKKILQVEHWVSTLD
jgi:glycerol-3-phosphate dehydrogenase